MAEQGAGASLVHLGAQWVSMSEAEKAPYEAKVGHRRADAEAGSAAAEVDLGLGIKGHLPFGLGCRDYPLDEKEVESVSSGAKGFQKEWHGFIGGVMQAKMSAVIGSTTSCTDVYGFGVCAQDVKDTLGEFVWAKKRLHALCKLKAHCPHGVDLLTVVHFVKGGGLGSSDDPPWESKILMLVVTLHSPFQQVYVAIACDDSLPQSGSTLRIHLAMTCFVFQQTWSCGLSDKAAGWFGRGSPMRWKL